MENMQLGSDSGGCRSRHQDSYVAHCGMGVLQQQQVH